MSRSTARVAALVVAVLATLSPVAVASAAPAAPAADDVRVYEGQYGAGSQTYTARCTGDTCTLTADRWPGELLEFLDGDSMTVTGGTATAELPNTCGDPSGDWHAPRSLVLTLTSTELTATIVTEKGEWRIKTSHCWSRGRTDVIRAQVSSPPATAEPTPRAAGAPSAGGPPVGGTTTDTNRPTTSRLGTGEGDAPSVLSGLRRAGDVEAPNLLVAALVTIVLVILIAFPTTLLNSAAEHGSDRFSTWWRRRRGAPVSTPTDEVAAGRPWWWAAGGVLVAGVIASFVDPQFGLNAGSARTMLSVLVGFGVEVLLGWLVVIQVVRRGTPGATPSYTFRPVTLAIVAGAVAFSRVTGFEPGIIFGLVAGVGFAALAGRREEARVALVPLGYGGVVALLGWAGYHLVDDATGAVGVFAAESLSAVAVAGFASLPIALFPVPGMPGATVFAWNRRVWAACYAVGLFAFFLVLMPTPYAWDEVGWSLRAWVLGYVAYLAAAVLAWWLVRRGHRADDASTADVVPPVDTPTPPATGLAAP